MADVPPINPNPLNPLPGAPTGAEPLKKSTGKVQPKKETVRINLPPKPTAAPTIKLPTLPPGGPTGAPSLVGAPALMKAPAPAAPPPTAAPVAKGAAPAAATAQQRPAPMTRPSGPIVPALKLVDKVLIWCAIVAAFAAAGGVGYACYVLKNTVDTFTS